MRPVAGKSADEVWPLLSQLIVHTPATGQLALTARRRGTERKERDDISLVRVEDLLITRVRGSAHAALAALQTTEVLDVVEHEVCGLAVEGAVLTAPDGRDVRREAHVDDHVLLAGVLVHGHAAHDLEAMSVVELAGDVSEPGVEILERERLRTQEAEGLLESCEMDVSNASSCKG